MTPDLFDSKFLNSCDPNGVILIEILRGLARFGVLANLNKNGWYRSVRNRANSLSPDLRDKVLKCLSTLYDLNRLVRHPKSMAIDPNTDCDWLKLALESHERIPFHAIILSKTLIENCGYECNEFVEFSTTLDSSQWEDSRRTTLTLNKSSADYRTNLVPILRYARKLALIDPYMKCVDRYIDTISICSHLLGNRGHNRLVGRIEIHSDMKYQTNFHSVDECLSEWRKRLRHLIHKDKHEFWVYLWESKENSESMHDRYLLTDQCGFSIPGGLDCRHPSRSHSNSTNWSLLDEDAWRLRWSNYDSTANLFKLIECAEICSR